MANASHDLLTPQDLADEVGVPVRTVYIWNSRGGGPRPTKVGRYVRYRRSEVDRWLEANTSDRRSSSTVADAQLSPSTTAVAS